MPNVGDTRYYEKIGENWIGCIDLECFKAQGGTYDTNVRSEQTQWRSRWYINDTSDTNAISGGKFAPNKFPLTDAIKVYNLATELTNMYLNINKDLSPEIKAQFQESMFKTLSGNFKP